MTKIQKAFWRTYKYRYLPLLAVLKNKQIRIFDSYDDYYVDNYFEEYFHDQYCDFYCLFNIKECERISYCNQCPLADRGVDDDHLYCESCFYQDSFFQITESLRFYRRYIRKYDMTGDLTEKEIGDGVSAEIERKRSIRLLRKLILKYAKQAGVEVKL